jgi:hypothetical protein
MIPCAAFAAPAFNAPEPRTPRCFKCGESFRTARLAAEAVPVCRHETTADRLRGCRKRASVESEPKPEQVGPLHGLPPRNRLALRALLLHREAPSDRTSADRPTPRTGALWLPAARQKQPNNAVAAATDHQRLPDRAIQGDDMNAAAITCRFPNVRVTQPATVPQVFLP